MAVDYASFSPEEKDNFVRNLLGEKEIEAAIRVATAGGRRPKGNEELLEFCFRVAAKKMDRLKGAIARKRDVAKKS
jgi:hypothetical protein